MPNFVILDPRTAGLPMARPTASVTPAGEARPATTAGREGPAKEQFAVDAARSRGSARSTPPRQNVPEERTGDILDARESGPFAAQRLAQEADSESASRSLLPTAMAAYLKARDSHVQILSSSQALDLRV